MNKYPPAANTQVPAVRDGDVVEKGTHNELLARGCYYAELYSSQFGEAA